MPGFFIFKIKRAKMDAIFNFLKDRFSITSGPMDIIFGLPSQANVRLLKNIISQFFSKYSKSHNILNIKRCVKLKSPQQKHGSGRAEAVKLHLSNSTLQKLFRMALIKSVALVVFEIFSNLVSIPNFLNVYNC